MMPPGWAVLLLCLSANAENILYGEFGEDVTLKCSSEGCPHSIGGYTGMYLYLSFKGLKEEVLYYYKEINVREKFQNRIQMKGSLRNNTITITISNLTVEDAGSYQCVYTHISKQSVQCKVHTLVVRVSGPSDAASASGSPCSPTPYGQSLLPAEEGRPCICESTMEKRPFLVLVIGVTFAISILVTMTSLLLILRVKHWSRNRRTATAPQVSEDSVYENMNKKSLHPLTNPQNS